MDRLDFSYRANVPSDLQELIPRFLENRQIDLKKIHEALDKNDFETLSRIGHTMKGACGGYGFDELSVLGKEIENMAKSSNRIEVENLTAVYEDYMKRVKIVFC